MRSLPEHETGRTHSENGKFVPKTGNLFRKREAGVEGKAYRREQEKGGIARNPARGRPPGGSWGEGFKEEKRCRSCSDCHGSWECAACLP